MTFSISLGMVVDSTFHIVHSFINKIKFDTYFKTTIIPIVSSTILLIFCFLLFGTNEFLPIKHFGLTLAFSILIGSLFDLFILPTLITGKTEHIKGI